MKKTMIAAALSLSIGYAAPAHAEDTYFSGTYTQCGQTTCTVYECQTGYVTGIETCSAIYSYPRPREVGGE